MKVNKELIRVSKVAWKLNFRNNEFELKKKRKLLEWKLITILKSLGDINNKTKYLTIDWFGKAKFLLDLDKFFW